MISQTLHFPFKVPSVTANLVPSNPNPDFPISMSVLRNKALLALLSASATLTAAQSGSGKTTRYWYATLDGSKAIY